MGSNASDENIWASTRVHNANREETNTEASLLNTPLAVPRPLMGWSGRAPAPPAREAGKGRQRQGARHAQQAQYSDRLGDRYRHRQELVPRRVPRPARYPRAAPEVVTRPRGSAARQPAAMLDRHGGLRWRTSS